MTIKKCNRCKKSIKDRKGVYISMYGLESLSADLCKTCSAPFLEYFKKHTKIKDVKLTSYSVQDSIKAW